MNVIISADMVSGDASKIRIHGCSMLLDSAMCNDVQCKNCPFNDDAPTVENLLFTLIDLLREKYGHEGEVQ